MIKLHNEELRNVVRVIKSRMMRYAEHVPRVGEMRSIYSVLVAKMESNTYETWTKMEG
jgi:hypothetical protein